MQFITTGDRILVEAFTIGNIYTITFTNGNYFSGSCIGIGADFVSFQRTAPQLLFVLNMSSASDVASIEEGSSSGTFNYNELENKPIINGVTLQGSLSLSDIGIASTDDLSALERDVDALADDQGIDRAALVELVDNGAKNLLDGAEQTISGTRTISFNISIPPGKYVIYVGEYASTDTDDTRAQAYFFDSNSNIVSTRFIQQKANGMYQEVTVSAQTAKFTIYASDNSSHGTGDTVTVAKIMICTKAMWDISHTYQPYRPSWQELYDMILSLS